MRSRTIHSRRRVTVTFAGAIVAVSSLMAATLISPSAGAAPVAVGGTAGVAIGFSGIELGVPQTSTFTGSIDDSSGSTNITVASTDLDVSLPIGGDTFGFTGTFSNPGGFSGNVSSSTAQLTGTARFKVTGVTIPGLDVPPLLALLPCTLDFVPAFTGTHDAAAGTIVVSDPSIAVPQFPALCAAAINLALSSAGLDLDINQLLAAAPPASATLSLTLDTPSTTTTTTTAPEPSVAPETSTPSTTTGPAQTTSDTTGTTTAPAPAPTTTAARPSGVPAAATPVRAAPTYTG